MENLRWSQKGMSFRGLVENTAMTKPALALIDDKISIVGEKFNGEFILASPCRVTGDRHQMLDREIVLSSRHSGIWKVISKTTSKKEGAIHRLTTKDLENIHRQDIENHRSTPRRFICMKDMEAFELLVRNNDNSVINGQRVDRRIKHLEENVEFEIREVGETEYTPTEGELTSQDYVTMPRPKSHAFANFWVPDLFAKQQKIRNRAVRSLCCVTKNGSQDRRFLLEVNELPCDIRPIASEGSTELRYLQSTKNLYDYLLSFGNDTVLLVKLVRGDMPMKAIDFDGYMVFRAVLSGDRVPICNVKDLEIKLVSPDISVPVKIPATETPWRSFSEIRAAEVQCMQFTLALLSRHESEVFITVDYDKGLTRYPTSKSQSEIRTVNFRTDSEPNSKTSDDQRKNSANTPISQGNYSNSSPSQSESHSKHTRISRRETSKSSKPESSYYQEASRSSMQMTTVHSPSERLYRNADQNASKIGSKSNSRYQDVRVVPSSRTHQKMHTKSSTAGSAISDSKTQFVGQYKSHASIF